MRQHPIDEIAPANFHRQEHAGIGATGANRINDRAGMKHNTLAGIEIRGRDAERDAEIFKSDALQRAGQKRDHAVVRSETASRKRPAGEGGEPGVVRDLFYFRKRKAAAIAGSDERAHAGAANETHGNIFLLENFEDSDM